MSRKKTSLFRDDEAPLRESFGETSFPNGCGSVSSMSLVGTRRDRRLRVRGRCPNRPGVYGFVNRSGVLVYVGMSRNLRHRLLTYFSSASRRGKEVRIAGQSGQLLWQETVHPIIARVRELELIRRFRPDYNVEGHPWRMREAYVVLVANEAAWFRLEKEPPAKSLGMWGPIPMNRRTIAAVKELNLHFRLRDCPTSTQMHFSDQTDLFPNAAANGCLRAETQSCLAPCIGCCSQKDYNKSLRAARQFLDGRPNSVLEDVHEQMRAASRELRFEKATRLRDVAQSLERLDGHLRKFHDWMAESTFVLPTSVGDAQEKNGSEHWLIVVRGAIQQVITAPTDAQQKSQALELLQQVSTAADSLALPQNFNHFQVARVVRAWFRKYPETQKKCWTLRQAIARCRRRRVA